MQYETSAEVEQVASQVIKQHLNELTSKKIIYVTQELKDDKTGLAVPQKRKGKSIIGDIKLIGGLNAFLASGLVRTDHNGPTPFAVVVVSRFAWNELKPNQREAWLHSQLYRLEYDGDTGKPSLNDFDVRENSMTVKLYGAYNAELATFTKAANQHPLFEDLENPTAEVVEQVAAPPAERKVRIQRAADKSNGNGKEPAAETQETKTELVSIEKHVAQRRGRGTNPPSH